MDRLTAAELTAGHDQLRAALKDAQSQINMITSLAPSALYYPHAKHPSGPENHQKLIEEVAELYTAVLEINRISTTLLIGVV